VKPTERGKCSTNTSQKSKRSPEESLYYVLATVYGEQNGTRSFDGKFEPDNRRVWNGLMGQNLSSQDKRNIASALKVDADELDPLGSDERLKIQERLDGTVFSIDDIPGKEDIHRFSRIDFGNILFEKPLLLRNRLFPSSTIFVDTIFSDNFSIANSILQSAYFHRAAFLRHAYFRETKIGTIGQISNACEFINCEFHQHAEFSEATLKNADFTKSLFHTSAHFENTIFFLGCPKFFEAELPENTLFPLKARNWKLPSTKFDRQGNVVEYNEADINREAVKYSALRKRMEAIQRPVEAGFFMRRELFLRSKLKGWDALLIKAYGFSSDYGYSVQRPATALILTILVGSAIYGGFFAQGGATGARLENSYLSGIGMSVSGTFSFLGLGRLFYSETLQSVPSPLAFVYGAQTLSGFVFSFLLGLGVRSRLRLK
jgi:hypothetical protein